MSSEWLPPFPRRNTCYVSDCTCIPCFVFGFPLFGQDTVSRVSEVSALLSHPLLVGMPFICNGLVHLLVFILDFGFPSHLVGNDCLVCVGLWRSQEHAVLLNQILEDLRHSENCHSLCPCCPNPIPPHSTLLSLTSSRELVCSISNWLWLDTKWVIYFVTLSYVNGSIP